MSKHNYCCFGNAAAGSASTAASRAAVAASPSVRSCARSSADVSPGAALVDTVPPGWTRPLAEALTRGSCQQSWHSHAFLHLEPRQTLTPPLTPPRRRALRLASTETRADPLRTCIVGQAVTHSSAASWRSSLPLLPLPRCRRGTCVPGGSSGAMSNTAQHKRDARRSRGFVPVSVSQCAA